MKKKILVTGATDGIGLETASRLLARGHTVLIHGRSPTKLKAVESQLAGLSRGGSVEPYLADLTSMSEVRSLADAVADNHDHLDVLINNAGIYKTPDPITADGLELRFVVNALAPWLLTQRLLPLLGISGRVINLSSAAQAPVDLDALTGQTRPKDDFDAYAQSKLALTTWSRFLGLSLGDRGPAIIAVNPGSLLGSKMVKEGFGVAGNDIGIGADILARIALDDEYASATGKYFDNDAGRFTSPHAEALDDQKAKALVQTMETLLEG